MYRPRNSISPLKHVQAGVPQGSVLGPLLFLIYINDVADEMVTFCRLYADDSSLQHSSNDLKSMETCLNSDLTKLQAWSDKWLLKFNPSKTKALFFLPEIKIQSIIDLTFNSVNYNS
jgi:hypothetical protein